MEAHRLFHMHCGSVKQDDKRYFILYLQLWPVLVQPSITRTKM